jgi:transcription antitermination factor NusG
MTALARLTPSDRADILPISYAEPFGWYVVNTDQRAEKEVQFGLWDAGFDTYLPIERVTKVSRGRKIDASNPLLPRYLFVAFDRNRDDEWGKILDLDGVTDLLRNDKIPSRIPSVWMETIWRWESCGIFDRTKGDPNGFKVGDVVRVTEGPFEGFSATIQAFAAKMKSATAKKRVKVLMSLMCRAVEIELDVTEIKKISPSAENMWQAA